ncbi:MAG: IS66 family transposase [Aestuariibacter sp.]|nr:IS66 family transposase [Aestuariibacter sp.]
MEISHDTHSQAASVLTEHEFQPVTPFSKEWITISKEEHIRFKSEIAFWKARHAELKEKLAKSRESEQFKDAKIKDLNKRLFGKKTEKDKSTAQSEKDNKSGSNKKRGQRKGSNGHGRTKRPNLTVVEQTRDLPADKKQCNICGLPHIPKPALDEQSEFIEVKVQAYTRRVTRPGYVRNKGCQCPGTPAVISAPPEPRLIKNSPYQVSFWTEVLLGKFLYAQPTHRYLQDLADQGLPVSPGTVAGGLKKITLLLEPLMVKLYQKQMSETLFHNDETRWEVFVELPNKVGSRWYLWVTRSESVVYFILNPSRATVVPQAHFAGLEKSKVIVVCDRYSAYKKLARLYEFILLAFCWAHVRRDFLDAGHKYKALEEWALRYKHRIGELYHLNGLRLQHWDSEKPIDEQSPCFKKHHQSIQKTLEQMHQEANKLSTEDEALLDEQTLSLPSSARKQQRKVSSSLLNHWKGLTLFVDNPQVPLDNNLAENSIRGPVTGRKNYRGSGSLWSAKLATIAFSLLISVVLWDINPRYWLNEFLTACAENNGKTPDDLSPFIPWEMSKDRREQLSRPQLQASPDLHNSS